MLRISAEMMVLAAMLPQLWAGLIGLVIAAYLARQRRKQRVEVEDSRGLIGWTALLSVVIVPLAMLAWGLYFWPDAAAGRGLHEQLALRGLDVLAVAQLAACLWLVWRRGGRPTAVAIAVLAMWWAAAAWGTAGMAVTNTWLRHEPLRGYQSRGPRNHVVDYCDRLRTAAERFARVLQPVRL